MTNEMTTEGKLAAFEIDSSPQMVLLDVTGRRNPVATPSMAATAIDLANAMMSLGGNQRITDMGWNEEDMDTILVYYRSYRGRPSKSEIARVARTLGTSEIRMPAETDEDEDLYVTGARAVVYPESCPRDADVVCFLVSGSIWYNPNRVTTNFPDCEDHEEIFLADINDRLTEGEVSFPR